MNWDTLLETDERLLWEGRPAPRCFTFRRWIHSVFGLILMAPALVWLDGGQALAVERGEPLWGVIPWLGVALASYFLVGHLLLARLDWEGTFYAITDRRLIALGGWPRRSAWTLPLNRLRHLRLRPRGRDLGSLYVSGQDSRERRVLSCLEHPARAIALLEEAVRRNLTEESSG